MSFSVEVENIKCGGCANSIRSAFDCGVEVDVDHGQVHFDADESKRIPYLEKLRALGYPEIGSTEGFTRVAAKAKSFVSCAIGKTIKK
jgi:copper chaperone